MPTAPATTQPTTKNARFKSHGKGSAVTQQHSKTSLSNVRLLCEKQYYQQSVSILPLHAIYAPHTLRAKYLFLILSNLNSVINHLVQSLRKYKIQMSRKEKYPLETVKYRYIYVRTPIAVIVEKLFKCKVFQYCFQISITFMICDL